VSSWFDLNLDPHADELLRTSANGAEGHLQDFPDLATFSERQRTCGMGSTPPISTKLIVQSRSRSVAES
jgi:hypothetical protein